MADSIQRPKMNGKIEMEQAATSSTALDEEDDGKRTCRGKRLVKKKFTLMYLLKVVCSSQETCIDWLKTKGLIPKILFCPNCSKGMTFEIQESALDGYEWICKDCGTTPTHCSPRHGSWLDEKNISLVDLMLFIYLWCHGFTEDQIAKETNWELELVKEWDGICSGICESVLRKREEENEEGIETNLKMNSRLSPSVIWRKRNKSKDLFLEFLKDADSL